MGQVLTRSKLRKVITSHQDDGKIVVFTNGCFDILHLGHVRYLQEAGELGNILVIGINSDRSVRKLKAKGRPIVPEGERAELLVALDCVDYVTIFDEQTPVELLEYLKPDIHVKGGDYKVKDLPESKTVLGYGGKVKILSFIPGKSTTNIIERIQQAYK